MNNHTIYIIYGNPGSGKTINAEAFQRCFKAPHCFDEGQQYVRKPNTPNSGDILILTCPEAKVVDKQGRLNQRWVKRNVPETSAIKVFHIEDAAALCRERGIPVNYPPFFPAV